MHYRDKQRQKLRDRVRAATIREVDNYAHLARVLHFLRLVA